MQEAIRLSLESTAASSATAAEAPGTPDRAGLPSSGSDVALGSTPPTRRFSRSMLALPAPSGPLDLDTDSEVEVVCGQPASASSNMGLDGHATHQAPVSLLVDLRERGSNRTPRDIYEAAQQQLQGVAPVEFTNLGIGDYLWLRGSSEQQGERLALACVERKTIRDLVGRSAKGDHLRQLRRLEVSSFPWSALLLEGDEEIADKGAVAYGAAPWASGGARDTALRCPADILRFVAKVALFSRSFVLLGKAAQDTISHLVAWTCILQHLGASPDIPFDAPQASAVNGLVKRCDERSATLVETFRVAGLFGADLEAVCNRFASVEDLQAHFRSCKDDARRGAMLVPVLLRAEAETGNEDVSPESRARAETTSTAVWQVCGGCAGDVPIAAGVSGMCWPPVLVVEATSVLLNELRQHGKDGVILKELPYLAKQTERARLRLQGGGGPEGDAGLWTSPPFQVGVLSGDVVLAVLQKALNRSSSAASTSPPDPSDRHGLAACAVSAADALVGAPRGAAAGRETTCRPRIYILEGVDLAARRICSKGQGSAEWGSASRIAELLPALVAALAIRHGRVALPRRNREKTLQLIFACGQVILEQDLLTL